MKTKCKAFVIQLLGTRLREARPAVSHYGGVLSDGDRGEETQRPRSSAAHSTFPGRMLGRVSLCQLPRWTHMSGQVMGEVEQAGNWL